MQVDKHKIVLSYPLLFLLLFFLPFFFFFFFSFFPPPKTIDLMADLFSHTAFEPFFLHLWKKKNDCETNGCQTRNLVLKSRNAFGQHQDSELPCSTTGWN